MLSIDMFGAAVDILEILMIPSFSNQQHYGYQYKMEISPKIYSKIGRGEHPTPNTW